MNGSQLASRLQRQTFDFEQKPKKDRSESPKKAHEQTKDKKEQHIVHCQIITLFNYPFHICSPQLWPGTCEATRQGGRMLEGGDGAEAMCRTATQAGTVCSKRDSATKTKSTTALSAQSLTTAAGPASRNPAWCCWGLGARSVPGLARFGRQADEERDEQRGPKHLPLLISFLE